MSTSITDPAFRELLQEALSEGHHVSAGVSSPFETAAEVIAVAEDAALEHLGEESVPGAYRLAIARGLAALCYQGEQELLGKVDALEERIAELRSALKEIVDAHDRLRCLRITPPNELVAVAHIARSAIDADHGDATENDATSTPVAEPTAYPVDDNAVARVKDAIVAALLHARAVPLRRGPVFQTDDGCFSSNQQQVIGATPMGLIARLNGCQSSQAPIDCAAFHLEIGFVDARDIDDGFNGHPWLKPSSGGNARWYELGKHLAEMSSVKNTSPQEGS